MSTPSRALAFRILLRLESRRSPTLADLFAASEIESLAERDRSFLHELVLGTLRHRGALDHALRPLLSRPLARLDSATLAALRLGAYQILRLRVPARAAVSESVLLAREHAPRASGLVNAVLRRLASEGPPADPDPRKTPLGWLTTVGSLPRWLAERWISRLGPASAVTRAAAFLETPPTFYRLNPRASGAEEQARTAGLDPQPLAVPGAWEAAGGRASDLAERGVLYIQDQGAQLIAHLAAGPGLRMDACAAPGGKTTLLADLAGDSGTIIAAEATPRRMRRLVRLVRRWGCSNVFCVLADSLRPPFRAPFHAVLLDAPCSGLGTLGRHPDIRWRTRPDDLVRHAARQRAMLESISRVLRPGGLLVYAVCSSEPEENENVVRSFLAEHAEFELEPPPRWSTCFFEGEFLRTAPETHRGDAFFAGLLRKHRAS